MANIVIHKIEISNCPNLAEVLEAVTTPANDPETDDINFFDFNTIIPEPPELKIINAPHGAASLAYFLTDRATRPLSRINLNRYDPAVRGSSDYKTVLNDMREILTMYDEKGNVKETTDDRYTGHFALPPTLDALYESGKAITTLGDNHGFTNWFSTRMAIWGTRFNCLSSIRNENGVVFDTAWSSPRPVIDAFAEKFNLTMTVKIAEEGKFFWNVLNYENGELVEERDCEDADKYNLYLELFGYEIEEESDEDEDENSVAVVSS